MFFPARVKNENYRFRRESIRDRADARTAQSIIRRVYQTEPGIPTTKWGRLNYICSEYSDIKFHSRYFEHRFKKYRIFQDLIAAINMLKRKSKESAIQPPAKRICKSKKKIFKYILLLLFYIVIIIIIVTQLITRHNVKSSTKWNH